VNKFKRDKIVKEEKKMSYDEAAILMPSFPNTETEDTNLGLITDHDLAHEKHLIKLLIENGIEKNEEGKFIAQYIFDEIEGFPLEQPDMIYLIEAYKKWFYEGKMPNGKTLQYHEDERVQKWVVTLFEPEQELSSRWNEKLGIKIKEIEKDIMIEINKSLLYFKLRKIKKMIHLNQADLENAKDADQLQMLQIHKHLKDIEKELTATLGTVIYK
jgi:DNA primase